MSEMNRREFLTLAGGVATVAALGLPEAGLAASGQPFVLAPLPYPANALEPVISEKTMGFHYGKHHLTYINNVNTALALPANSQFQGLTLEQIMLKTANQAAFSGLFNNSAQAVNHEFYWGSLMPQGGDSAQPSGKLLTMLEAAFGDYAAFKNKFRDAAVGQFGAGWAWLVEHQGKLEIITTSNADNPKTRGMKPLLTIDVWEHAYYLDWQNQRKDHVQAVIDKLLNWKAAAIRISA